jgi:hypothetical protein
MLSRPRNVTPLFCGFVNWLLRYLIADHIVHLLQD